MKGDESDGSIYIHIQLIDTDHVNCNHISRYMLFIRCLTQNIIILVQNNFLK